MPLPQWTQHLEADIRAKAVDLSRTGFADAAWPIAVHREVIETLLKAGFAILEGDILKGRRRDLEHTYDGWSTSLEPGEAWPAFVKRSCAKASDYLAKMQGEADLWFTATVSAKPSAAQRVKGRDR